MPPVDNSLKNGVLIILFFFISLFIYSKIAGGVPFSVNSINTNKSDLFQTTGTGEVQAVPDKATVYLGVTQNSTTADDARAKANLILNKVVSDLKVRGIKETDIKATNFSVYPVSLPQPAIMAPDQGTSLIMPSRPGGGGTSYTSSANIEVKASSTQLANQAIDIATRDGANVVGGVTFTFDDSKKKDLENQARIKAVQDAKQKAQNLADAAGIRLGRVINIQESQNGFPLPMAAGVKAGSTVSDQTQLNPGENKVTITVTLTFETL